MSMTNREWLYSLDVADLADWFDAEHVEHDEVDANDTREKLEADVTVYLIDKVTTWSAERYALNEEVIRWLDRQAAITERRYRELTGTFQLESDKRIAELQEQVDELREKLGIALDHAHDTLSLVDLEGNVL